MSKDIKIVLFKGDTPYTYNMPYNSLNPDDEYIQKIFDGLTSAFASINQNQRSLCAKTPLTDYMCRNNFEIHVLPDQLYDDGPSPAGQLEKTREHPEKDHRFYTEVPERCFNLDAKKGETITDFLARSFFYALNHPTYSPDKNIDSQDAYESIRIHSQSQLLKLAFQTDVAQAAIDGNLNMGTAENLIKLTNSGARIFNICLSNYFAHGNCNLRFSNGNEIEIEMPLVEQYLKGPMAIDMKFRGNIFPNHETINQPHLEFMGRIKDQQAGLEKDFFDDISQVLAGGLSKIMPYYFETMKGSINQAMTDIYDDYKDIANGKPGRTR